MTKQDPPTIRKVSLDKLSYTAIPLRLLNGESNVILASGTGFIYKKGSRHYLITNWHNVTGVNPQTNSRISHVAASPTSVAFPLHVSGKPHIEWRWVRIELYSNSEPNWSIHPEHAQRVDVVAIELDKLPADLCPKPINDMSFEDIAPQVADTVYVLGFPESLSAGGNFPLWKRGSIASEPDIDIGDLPKMLIDTTSRPGMSGSPVIYRRQGIHKLQDGAPTNNSLIGEIQNFCDIYSGRVNTGSELDTQLGIVWKADVIEQIIVGATKDKGYYPEMSFTGGLRAQDG